MLCRGCPAAAPAAPAAALPVACEAEGVNGGGCGAPVVGRYVTIRRTDGANQAVSVVEMEVYKPNGRKYTARVKASLGPAAAGAGSGAANLKDGNTTGPAAVTVPSSSAFVKLDLRADRPILKVVVYNVGGKLEAEQRIVGCSLAVHTAQGAKVWEAPIGGEPFTADTQRIFNFAVACPDAGSSLYSYTERPLVT